MLAVLKRLIDAVLKVGLYEFLRRVGWKWAIGAIVSVVVIVLIGLVLIALLIGLLL